jgi:hypothetical protein
MNNDLDLLFADDTLGLGGVRRLAARQLLARRTVTMLELERLPGLPPGGRAAVRALIDHPAFRYFGGEVYLTPWALAQLGRTVGPPDPLAGARAAVARATNVATVAEALAHAKRADRCQS